MRHKQVSLLKNIVILFVLLLVKPTQPLAFGNFFQNDDKSVEKTRSNVIVSFADAVERSAPAVVSIQTTKEIPQHLHPLLQDPFFRFFFGDPSGEIPAEKQKGLGSGVIISKKGYVLTNNHVIKDATSIIVKLSDGRTSEAKVIGTDPRTDLAVLKISLKDAPEIPLGSSKDLKVGDVVLAIGNPFGVNSTVTQGIISATGSLKSRLNDSNNDFGDFLDNLIQTDAAINPGNSGGALIDSNGTLIGINTAIISPSGGSSGIGFAIPVDTAKDIMHQLIDTGKVIRGWLGAYLGELTDEIKKYTTLKEPYGVYVRGTFRNSPAQKAGLLPGDIILKIDDKKATNITTAIKIVSSLKPNTGYAFEVFRKGEYITFSVVIGTRPKED